MRAKLQRWKHRNPEPDDKFWSVMLWFLLPGVAVYMLVLAPSSLSASFAAARGDGLPGTFTAVREDCGGRGPCSFYGRFESVDGSVRFRDVLIDSGPSRVGQSVPALYEGERNPPKVYEEGSREWMFVVGLTVAAIVYLVLWARNVVRLLRHGPSHYE